ncbi:hypothetical protein PSENEW3_00006055 [Picochlorum sp. SENEW3]|nr:hypothetical protein PSENEW3_00006055 [Picochlorum sp. SENEW3]
MLLLFQTEYGVIMSAKEKNVPGGMKSTSGKGGGVDCPESDSDIAAVHGEKEYSMPLNERVVALEREIERMNKVRLDELREAHELYRLAQQDGLRLEKDMEAMRREMETKCAVIEEEKECIRQRYAGNIDAMTQRVQEVQAACQQHMVDPETQRMLRKYMSLSSPVKGFVFANYSCLKRCQKKRLARRCSRVKQVNFVNMVRLESCAKLMQLRAKRYKKECTSQNAEIINLKKRLERKYQEEIEQCMKILKRWKAQMQHVVAQEERHVQEQAGMEQQLAVAKRNAAHHREENANLHMSLRKMEAKIRKAESDMARQQNEDVQLKLFLQSCMYAMNTHITAHQSSLDLHQLSSMSKKHRKELQKLYDRVEESQHGGVEITAMSPEDVRAFISLLVQRMNT